MDTVGQFVLVGLVLIGTAALVWFLVKRGRTTGMGIPVLVSAMLTIVVGAIGFLVRSDNNKGGFGIESVNAIYFGAQHVLLNAPADSGDNIWMGLSRMLGLATALLAAFAVIRGLFRDTIERAWMRCTRNHILICGLGRIGEEVARSALNAGKRVVIIERDEQNDLVEPMRELGAIVMFGDASNAGVLRGSRASSASHVYYCTGDDEGNADGVSALIRLIGKPNAKSPIMLCNMANAELGRRLEQSGAKDGFSVLAFNVTELAALEFLDHKLADVVVAKDETVHFVIIGFGTMAQTLVLELAELAHFGNLRRSRMTIVTEKTDDEATARFRNCYPRVFGEEATNPWRPDPSRDDWAYGVHVSNVGAATHGDKGVEFVLNGGFTHLRGLAQNPELVNHLCELSATPGVRPIVIVCGDAEDDNSALAQRLRDDLDIRIVTPGPPRVYRDAFKAVPIYAFVPWRKALGEMASSPDLTTFGACGETCTHDRLSFQLEYRLAEVIYNDYHKNDSPPAPPFAQASGWEKRSNRSAAAQVNIKLAPLGLRVEQRVSSSTPQSPDKITEPQRQLFARIEHNRWLAERLISGWSFGVRDNRYKTRHQIVDWAHLPASEQKKDDAQAAAVLSHCQNSDELALVHRTR